MKQSNSIGFFFSRLGVLVLAIFSTIFISSHAFAGGGDSGGNEGVDKAYGAYWGEAGSGRGAQGVTRSLDNVISGQKADPTPGRPDPGANNWGLGNVGVLGDRG